MMISRQIYSKLPTIYLFPILKECLNIDVRRCENIFDVDTTYSNSVSTQLTIRNGKLMNLPLNFIVVGDFIMLKPGQMINLNCRSQALVNGKHMIFETGQIYSPIETEKKEHAHDQDAMNNFDSVTSSLYQNKSTNNNDFNIRTLVSSCKFRQIPQSMLCVATESPYLSHLK
jgi:hypothetical protein